MKVKLKLESMILPDVAKLCDWAIDFCCVQMIVGDEEDSTRNKD